MLSAPADPLAGYLPRINEVDGWLSNATLRMSIALMGSQRAGHVCEIGVHHGRYLIGLALGLRADERAIAIDLFGRQEENVDRSGSGSLDPFLRHVAEFLPDPARVVPVEANSLNLKPADIAKHGPIRFFSVDGGHTAQAAENDLRLAEATITLDGVVALDDILSPHWTGVITGFANYHHGGGRLRPFALVPNKLFLCSAGDPAGHRAFMARTFPDKLQKADVEFFGVTVDTYGD